jgi:hypothetical protein
MEQSARRVLLFGAAAGAALALSVLPLGAVPNSVALGIAGRVLAPVNRQIAWLNLEAPRPRILTKLGEPAYVTDVAFVSNAPFAVAAIAAPFGDRGTAGADLYRLDTDSGAITPLVKRATAQESLTAPAWWQEASGVLYERDDLNAVLPSFPGQVTPRFASRIDVASLDGTARTLVDNGRMPAPSPDGGLVALVRTAADGTGLVLWSRPDGEITSLLPDGTFADIAYPRFSPDGARIAFLVPGAFVGNSASGTRAACDGVLQFGPCVALAHGLPWNLWTVRANGTDARELAEVESDDGSAAWSPDSSELLVYGGSGGFLVDATTGDFQLLTYVSGYGSIAWVPD